MGTWHDASTVMRSTRWRCLKGPDADPGWEMICEVAAAGVMDPIDLKARVAAKENLLRALPETARRLGVADRVIERACARHEDAARRVEAAR